MGNCKYRGTFPRLKFTVISIRFAIRIIYAKRSAYHIAYLSSLLPKTWIDTESKKKKKKKNLPFPFNREKACFERGPSLSSPRRYIWQTGSDTGVLIIGYIRIIYTDHAKLVSTSPMHDGCVRAN